MYPVNDESQNYLPTPATEVSPAGPHSEGVRMQKGRMSDIWETPLFHWIKKRLPSPGAGNYAFSSLGLIELSPIGPSVAARNLYRDISPQLYVPFQSTNTSGVGGLAAGQYISQPLLNPDDDTYGGVPIP